MFDDRIDAGQQSATALEMYKDHKDAVVMALPRGGVVLGYVIAKELNLPLELAMVKKLGHPSNSEYAIGAVSMKGRIFTGHPGVSEQYVENATQQIQQMLKERYNMYRGNQPPLDLKKKIVIVVDDGVATGQTLMAALDLIREEQPKQIVVAVPVGPTDTIEELKDHGDKVVCLETYDNFRALGLYYRNFDQVSDDEVKDLLNKAA